MNGWCWRHHQPSEQPGCSRKGWIMWRWRARRSPGATLVSAKPQEAPKKHPDTGEKATTTTSPWFSLGQKILNGGCAVGGGLEPSPAYLLQQEQPLHTLLWTHGAHHVWSGGRTRSITFFCAVRGWIKHWYPKLQETPEGWQWYLSLLYSHEFMQVTLQSQCGNGL